MENFKGSWFEIIKQFMDASFASDMSAMDTLYYVYRSDTVDLVLDVKHGEDKFEQLCKELPDYNRKNMFVRLGTKNGLQIQTMRFDEYIQKHKKTHEIEQLKRKLKEAIAKEDFELCATLRDKINEAQAE